MITGLSGVGFFVFYLLAADMCLLHVRVCTDDKNEREFNELKRTTETNLNHTSICIYYMKTNEIAKRTEQK